MKKNNQIVKLLIPLVAVVVILESVVLIGNLSSKERQVVVPTGVTPTVKAQPTKTQAVFDIGVVTGDSQMKVAGSYPVEINLKSKGQYAVDAIDLYVKYDPTAFTVSNLGFDAKLPKPTFSKISKDKSVVVVNYLISLPQGLVINQIDLLSLVKFDVKPLKTGNYSFEIGTGTPTKESVTMIVENGTNNVLPFTSNKLNVVVSK